MVSLESAVILLGGYEYGGYGIIHTTVAKLCFQNDLINPEATFKGSKLKTIKSLKMINGQNLETC